MVYKCSTCKIDLSIDNGYFTKGSLASHYCREHHKIKARKWRLKNKEKSRNHRFVHLYGITTKEYEKMYANQNGSCAICETPNLSGKLLCVDHDHKTGRVRGLLCDKHNWMIGHANDNILTLYRAADYLEKHKS